MKAIISLVVLAALCMQATGQAQGNKYAIVYNTKVPDTTRDDWEVYAMNMDGTNKRNITNNRDVAWAYYSYKDRLYWISDRDTCYRCYFLYESDVNGKNIRKVSGLQLEDSWMSSRNNGEEFVVTGRIGRAVRLQLFLLNVKTGTYKQLTNDTAARYGDPCFSPDGKQIVFSYKKNKRDRSTHEELFVMNADGTGMTQLTRYPEDNVSAKEFGYKAGAARWHPTENFITYISQQDGRHSIFAVTPDGKKQWKLTKNDFEEGWHDWSPDGQWLAFNSSDVDGKQYQIMLVNWKTKEQKQLTDNSMRIQQAPVFVGR